MKKYMFFLLIIFLHVMPSITLGGECIEGDCVNGQGTEIYPAGGKYIGAFSDSQRNGEGTYLFPNGTKYIGGWQNGRYSGQGTYIYPNKTVYVGKWKDGKKHGKGVQTIPGGVSKEVYWLNGKYVRKEKPERAIAEEERLQEERDLAEIEKFREERRVNARSMAEEYYKYRDDIYLGASFNEINDSYYVENNGRGIEISNPNSIDRHAKRIYLSFYNDKTLYKIEVFYPSTFEPFDDTPNMKEVLTRVYGEPTKRDYDGVKWINGSYIISHEDNYKFQLLIYEDTGLSGALESSYREERKRGKEKAIDDTLKEWK